MALDIADLARRAAQLGGGEAVASVSERRELVVLSGPHGTLVPPRRTSEVVVRLLIRDGAGRLGLAHCSMPTGDDALHALADRAHDNAGVAAFDLTPMSEIGPTASHEGFDLLTADLDPVVAAAAARDAAAAIGYDLGASRTARWQAEDVSVAVASSDGALARDRRTGAQLTASSVDADGRLVGLSQASSSAADRIDASAVGLAATPPVVPDGRRDGPVLAGPGDAVVLLPAALAPLLEALARAACTGHAHATGTSPHTGRLGTAVAPDLVTLWDDPSAPESFARGLDVEGVAARPVALVDRGIAADLVHDAASADEAGTISTGHATELGGSAQGAAPRNLVLEPGSALTAHELSGSGTCIVVPAVVRVMSSGPGSGRCAAIGRGAYAVTDGFPTALLGDVLLSVDLTDLLAGIESMSEAVELVATMDRMPERTRATSCPAVRTRGMTIVAT